MFNNKKAQAQIITVVLIILLVLAAIVIIWQVIQATVRESAEEVTTQSSCIGLNMIVVRADVSDNQVIVRREPGASQTATVNAVIFVNGQNTASGITNLAELDSETITVNGMVAGDEIQAAAKLPDGTACSLGPGRNAVA